MSAALLGASSALKTTLKMKHESAVSQNLRLLKEIFPKEINSVEEFQKFLRKLEKIEKETKLFGVVPIITSSMRKRE